MARREEKKTETRARILAAAARLFGEHGYESVSVSDVARASGVSDQTVYNYFATKERLVTDREDELRARLVAAVRDRSDGVNPAAAIRPIVLGAARAIRSTPPEVWRGELARMSALSPAVHRLALELAERLGSELADAIRASGERRAIVARLQGAALAEVFRIFLREAGDPDAKDQATLSRRVRSTLAAALDELDRWWTG